MNEKTSDSTARIGQVLPEFRAPSSHGQTLDRSAFAGKVGVVVFVPADGGRRDPELDEWDEHLVNFGHLRVQVLGVLRTTAKMLREESEEAARSVTLLADEDGSITAAVAAGDASAPTLIADRDGTIVDVVERNGGDTGHVTEVLRRVESLHDRLDSMRPDVEPAHPEALEDEMTRRLDGKRVAFLVANEGIEQTELEEPWQAVVRAGGTPELIAPEAGEAQAFRHLDPADTFPVDRTTAEVSASDYDALVLPGGVANADAIRTDEDAVRFVGQVVSAHLPIAVICHGPWILTEVDAVRGRTMTSWPSLQTDLRNAGAQWVDEEVHVDRGLVSSRKPDDLPAFCEAMLAEFSAGPQVPKPEAGAPLAV